MIPRTCKLAGKRRLTNELRAHGNSLEPEGTVQHANLSASLMKGSGYLGSRGTKPSYVNLDFERCSGIFPFYEFIYAFIQFIQNFFGIPHILRRYSTRRFVMQSVNKFMARSADCK